MVKQMANLVQTDMERIRSRLNALLDRKGHGAIGGFAKRVGISRQYLARFRKGQDVGWQTLQAIRHELDSEDNPVNSPEPRETTERIVVRTCSSCGEEVPARFRGIKLLFCGHCGEPLGVECPNCEHLNTDQKAMYCTACGEPLTDEAYEAREGLAKITESEKEKQKRKAEERRQRDAERRKSGEPKL